MILCFFVAMAQAGTTDDLATARAHFHAGDFLGAADEGERIGSAPALALAARALAIHGHHIAAEGDRLAHYERAVQLGEQAVALDPSHAQAHFQLAHAVGRFAELLGVLEALSEGFASRMRVSIDAGLAAAPDDPFGHLLLANWHAGIIEAAGFVGGLVYGADEDEAFAHFALAIEIAPNSALVRVSYAEAILKLDADEYRDTARVQLEAAVLFDTQTALERIFIERGKALLARLMSTQDGGD